MMFQRTRPSTRRSAFTLVELMVVILIISILSALLTVAVARGITSAKRTRNQVDIRQLAAAVEAFKNKYKVEYIPSQLLLSEQGNYSGPGALTSGSIAYLRRIWPRLTFPVDWNGNGKIDPPAMPGNVSGDMILQGDQVLVFFLGGIPRFDATVNQPDTNAGPVSCTGFSKNPGNPAAHLSGGAAAENPLYEFDSSRLVALHPKDCARMLSYLDTYGTGDGKGHWLSGMPYAYFSSYQTRNGYNFAFSSPSPSVSPATDCSCPSFTDPVTKLTFPGFTAWPYAQGMNQYLNPTGFQIISAGADGAFGTGSTNPNNAAGLFWTPATAANSGALGSFGADDQSNFYDNLLGTPSIN